MAPSGRKTALAGRGKWRWWAALSVILATQASVQAVIFYATGDLTYNTSAPTGALAGSGWQWVGLWDGFQGAPIGPHHFLAARHIGGAVGDPFVLSGVSYTTTAFYDDAASDLRIWQISGTFPTWAPLYRTGDELGRPLVVFGRGLTRGSEIRVGGMLNGWMWGTEDGQLRWGENAVAAIRNGGAYWGSLLYATFDATGGPNEVDLAVGDSSAPVFIDNGAGWALAGVAAAVDSSFNTTNSGSGFSAAIFDARGLYYTATPPTGWQLITGSAPVPTGFYATQVSARVSWIDAIVPPADPGATSEPLFSPAEFGMYGVLLVGTGGWYLRRRRVGESMPA